MQAFDSSSRRSGPGVASFDTAAAAEAADLMAVRRKKGRPVDVRDT